LIFVTGATGFVGSALLNRLLNDGFEACASIRGNLSGALKGVKYHQIEDIHASTDWSLPLIGVRSVVHCAARVHVMQDNTSDNLAAYRQVNVAGTLNLARQAAHAGVHRFLFISSIKVNGETTKPGQRFNADDVPAPIDPYGMSKLEAEQGLREIESHTGMEVVIVRPPLVYGPGVKANFASMMRWLSRGIPLPLGAIHNSRSLVAVESLVDLLLTCLVHPAAAGQTFLVSDGEDLSTTDLLRRTALTMGIKPVLLPVPVFLLEFGGALLGKRALVKRLCGSLQIDIKKTQLLLDWTPPLTVEQGLKKAIESTKQ
jgi:nucleoside-diphosphate-sugar epimerase